MNFEMLWTWQDQTLNSLEVEPRFTYQSWTPYLFYLNPSNSKNPNFEPSTWPEFIWIDTNLENPNFENFLNQVQLCIKIEQYELNHPKNLNS